MSSAITVLFTACRVDIDGHLMRFYAHGEGEPEAIVAALAPSAFVRVVAHIVGHHWVDGGDYEYVCSKTIDGKLDRQ